MKFFLRNIFNTNIFQFTVCEQQKEAFAVKSYKCISETWDTVPLQSIPTYLQGQMFWYTICLRSITTKAENSVLIQNQPQWKYFL